MRASFSLNNVSKLYLLNLTTDRPNDIPIFRQNLSRLFPHVVVEVNLAQFLALEIVQQNPLVVLVAHGNSKSSNLYATRNAALPVSTRDEIVSKLEAITATGNSAGVRACICSGNVLEGSTSTDIVDYVAYTFKLVTADLFINAIEKELSP